MFVNAESTVGTILGLFFLGALARLVYWLFTGDPPSFGDFLTWGGFVFLGVLLLAFAGMIAVGVGDLIKRRFGRKAE